MKIWRTLQYSLMVLVLTGLLAACSTTPPPAPSTTDGQQGQVEATDVGQQPAVKGVDSGPVSLTMWRCRDCSGFTSTSMNLP